MINTTINNCPITSPSAAFLFGQVAAQGVSAFTKIESVDIVKSLFGISVENPNAMDITTAIVNEMSETDQNKIRNLLQDHGTNGIIWRFTTSKLFMVEMSKIIDNHGNFISLSLITRGDDGITVNVRELVQFNKDRTTFLNRRVHSIDMIASIYDELTRLHEEAVAKLETELLSPPKEPVIAGIDPGKEEKSVEAVIDTTKTPPVIVSIKEKEADQNIVQKPFNIKFEGFEVFPEPEVTKAGITAAIGAIINEIDGDKNTITKELNDMIENSPIKGTLLTYKVNHVEDDSVYGEYTIKAIIEDLPLEDINDPEILSQRDENLKYLFDASNHLKEWCNENAPDRYFLDEFDKTIGAIPENIRKLFITKFPENWKKIEQQRLDYYNKIVEIEKQAEEAMAAKVEAGQNKTESPTTIRLSEMVDNFSIDFRKWKSLESIDAPNELTDHSVIHAHDAYYMYLKGEYLLINDINDIKYLDYQFAMNDNIIEKENEKIILTINTDIISLSAIQKSKLVSTIHAKLDGLRRIDLNSNDCLFKAIHDAIIETIGEEFESKFMYTFRYNHDTNKLTIEELIPSTADIPNNAESNEQTSTPETKKEEPMDQSKEYKITVADSLKDLIETIQYSLTKIIDESLTRNNGDLSLDEDLSKELSEVMEMDLTVHTNPINPDSNANHIRNLEFIVDEAPAKPEIPSADIHDTEVQNGLLRGLFGVIDPAITHLQKFMHKHLTDENNVGYLSTGTFPTETSITWNEKPYDFTLSIIKFKDGRFYRMYLAGTDPSLTDQTWLATRDIPDRWIRLGRDIQNQMNVPSFQGRRPR